MTTPFKSYTKLQRAAIAAEERIVWVGFPSSYRFLVEHWVDEVKPDGRPQLENLVAYSVAGPSSPVLRRSGGPVRRAWASPPILPKYREREAPRGSVDPSSIEAGQPSRLAEGAAE
jgi:hypothetical protein